MKKFYLLFIYTFLLFSYACTKQDMMPDKKSDLSSASSGIKCIDGILHFNSAEVCIAAMDSLLNNENYRTDFEKNYNFTSLATETDEKITILFSIENESIRNAALEEFKEYVYQDEDSLLLPVVPARGYALIANKEGVFYIGDIKHKISGNYVTIEEGDKNTKGGNYKVHKFSYLAMAPDEYSTKSEQKIVHADVRYEKDKKRVFAKIYTFCYIFFERPSDKPYGETTTRYTMQVEVSGHKKSMFGWNSYKTKYTIEDLAYKYTIYYKMGLYDIEAGIKAPLAPFNSLSAVDVKVFYKNFDIKEFKVQGEDPVSGTWIENAQFRLRAKSKETGNCGAVVNQIPGMAVLPNCK